MKIMLAIRYCNKMDEMSYMRVKNKNYLGLHPSGKSYESKTSTHLGRIFLGMNKQASEKVS